MAIGLGVMYGVQAAAGLGKLGFGLHQAGLAREKEMALRSAGLPQMSTAQEYFDLYQNASRSKQFEQEKAMTQSVLASNLATLQGAGSRAVIGGAGAAHLRVTTTSSAGEGGLRAAARGAVGHPLRCQSREVCMRSEGTVEGPGDKPSWWLAVC